MLSSALLRTMVLASALTVWLLAPGAIAAPEERCTELGRNCVCSEPLNVSQSLPRKTHVNPTDSTRLECPGEPGDGRAVRTKNGGITPQERLMPRGNRVDRVWGVNGGGINFLEGVPDAITPNTRRVCQRIYVRFSSRGAGDDEEYSLTTSGSTCLPSDVGYPDCCERNKGMSMSSDSLANYSINDGSDTFHGNWIVRAAGGGIARDKRLKTKGSSLGISDCKDTWCRLEMCVAGNLWRGRKIYPEARLVQLSTGAERFFYDPEGPLDGTAPMTSFDRVWIANMFRQVNVNVHENIRDPKINKSSDHACRGTRFISHAMQAQWDRDDGQWIGAAYEVESGGGPVDSPPQKDPVELPADDEVPDLGLPDQPVLIQE